MSDGFICSDAVAWLSDRRKQSDMSWREIPFSESREWNLVDGALVHETGGFFSIEGARTRSSRRALDDKVQPIINQPEVGILGFIATRGANGLDWLVQAKNEPGNVNFTQLAPSVQATYSNYMQRHGGAATHYLPFFLEEEFDLPSNSLQSEQGTRFLLKYNRNAVCIVDRHLAPKNDNFRWVTSAALRDTLGTDYAINTDARSVLTTAPWSLLGTDGDLYTPREDGRWPGLSDSYAASINPDLLPAVRALVQRLRDALTLTVDRCDLVGLRGWDFDGSCIGSRDKKYPYEVRQYSVEATDREKPEWDQPLVKSTESDKVVLFCQRRQGLLRFLLRPSIEIGLNGGVEIGPSYKQEAVISPPDWLMDLVDSDRHTEIITVKQSDEGGRFMTSRCRFSIVEIDKAQALPSNDDCLWVTLNELESLCRHPKMLTNEARSVISLLLTFA